MKKIILLLIFIFKINNIFACMYHSHGLKYIDKVKKIVETQYNEYLGFLYPKYKGIFLSNHDGNIISKKYKVYLFGLIKKKVTKTDYSCHLDGYRTTLSPNIVLSNQNKYNYSKKTKNGKLTFIETTSRKLHNYMNKSYYINGVINKSKTYYDNTKSKRVYI